MTQMIACPSCDTPQPATRHFCGCGAYLAWGDAEVLPDDAGARTGSAAGHDQQPTGVLPKQEAPAAGSPVEVDVRVSGDDAPGAGPLRAVTEAGAPVELVVHLRNVGRRVDTLSVHVRDLPSDWGRLHDASARLLPPGQGTRGGAHDVRVVLSPPRASRAVARDWPFEIAIHSQALGRDVASVDGVLTVLPFHAVVVSVHPRIASGRQRASVACDIRNNGNAAVAPIVVFDDAERECQFDLPAGPRSIGPGSTVRLLGVVRAPKRHLFGRPRDRQLTFSVDADGLEAPTPPQPVTFRQRPLIPWWVPLVLLLLAVIAVALVLLLRSDEVTTPQLKGAGSAFVAQRQLRQAGFTSAPLVTEQVAASVLPGTVLDQVPPAGTKVLRSYPVMLRVAVQPSRTLVPDLRGSTAAEAEGVLTKARLSLGQVTPSKRSRRRIVHQIPIPGVSRPRGTPIDVVLATSPRVAVPDVTCVTAAGAEKRLARRGLRLGPVPSTVGPKRKANGQIPAAGVKRRRGTQVLPLFTAKPKCGAKARRDRRAAGAATPGSRGSAPTSPAGGMGPVGGTGPVDDLAPPVDLVLPPATPARDLIPTLEGDLAFDDGQAVRLAGEREAVGPGRDAAWSVDGRRLAMRHGSRIIVREARVGGPQVQSIGVPAARLRLPAFSPAAPTAPVLAVVARKGDRDRVCVVPVTGRARRATCPSLPLKHVRGLAWRSDGGALLVAATTPADTQPGLLVVTAPAAGSGTWRLSSGSVHPRLDQRGGAVLDVAALPLGGVALVADAGDGPQLVTAADATLAGARWTGRPACRLAPSPDGRRIAVVEPGDGGCGSGEPLGRLTVVWPAEPTRRASVADQGSRPAWRARRP